MIGKQQQWGYDPDDKTHRWGDCCGIITPVTGSKPAMKFFQISAEISSDFYAVPNNKGMPKQH
jgi:hypothetical protein